MAEITASDGGTGQTASGLQTYTVNGSLDPNTGEATYTVLLNGQPAPLMDNRSFASINATLGDLISRPGRTDTDLWKNVQQTLTLQNGDLLARYQQQVPKSNSEPVTPDVANKPDPNTIAGTSAGDDNSYDKNNAAANASKANSDATDTNNTEVVNKSFAGTTAAGSANTTNETVSQKRVGKDPKPGTRLNNPLGNFSSYTYQISLYMITPDAHTAFVSGGRKDINQFAKSGADSGTGGAYLILQSGGVNTNLNKRPPGMDYDYYVDDLRITNKVSTQQTATSSNITKITFNVIEPYGFSFITKLKRAREALAAQSKIPNIQKAVNASKQFFVLGIRFQGYDANGEIANASKYFSDDTFNASPDASGVYERLYDILIEKISFKLGGGSTTYAITAKNIASEIGLHVARGTVDANMELVADTVGTALDGSGQGVTSLFQTMNNNLAKAKDAGSREFPDEYYVRWLGEGAARIQNATLRSDVDPDKKKSAPAPANNASEVNEALSQGVLYDNNRIKISITQGMSVLQAIEKIIKQSSYMEDALETLFESEETPNEDTASPDKKIQKDPPTLRWYNVSPEIEVIAFDTKINDFAYKITYVIQPYDTPAAVSPYGRTAKYYGPHKRYDYWYTGQNKEILSYEQQYDNTFFNITFNPDGDPAASGGDAKIAQLGNKPTTAERTGRISPGIEAHNTYMTSLFDPGAYAQARVQILGDPDFLMREAAGSVNEVYKQFYQSDNFTINPNGGQVFIEIAFNEGIDYDTSVGTMKINDSIFFWDYPDNIKTKLKGVSYQVRECESVFKGGKFTQTLQLNINTMPDAIEAAEQAAQQRSQSVSTNNTTTNTDVRTGSAQGSATPTPGSNQNNSSAGTGLVTDNKTNTDASQVANAGENSVTSNTGTQSTNVVTTNNANNPVVADDDSVANSGATTAGTANNTGPNSSAGSNTTDPDDTRKGTTEPPGDIGP